MKWQTCEVRTYNCSECDNLQKSLDMVSDELQNVINEKNKLAQEEKNWQFLLEASQIEVDLLTKELEEKKIHLNTIWKSCSHNFVQLIKETI